MNLSFPSKFSIVLELTGLFDSHQRKQYGINLQRQGQATFPDRASDCDLGYSSAAGNRHVWLVQVRERSQSFIQLPSASVGGLISTGSFHKDVNNGNRQHQGQVLGVVVQNDRVVSTELLKASRAIREHAGQSCLWALKTGLLCSYSLEATKSILSELIQFALLPLDQEDAKVKMEGPLFTGLKQYVSAIAVEEDSNAYRTHPLQATSNLLAQFTSATLSGVLACDSPDVFEPPLVIGCLKWMLTPLHRRDLLQNPTRSLQVWAFLQSWVSSVSK